MEVVIDSSCVMKVDRGLEFFVLCNFHLIYKSTFLFLTYLCVCVWFRLFCCKSCLQERK